MKTKEDVTREALALIASGAQTALLDLVACLKNNGALRDGQFEAALNRTISHPEAQRDRLDYRWLSGLLKLLEQSRPPDEEPTPPSPFVPRLVDQ